MISSALFWRNPRTVSALMVAFGIAGIVFGLMVANTPCARADGTCGQANDEGFDQDVFVRSGTAFETTITAPNATADQDWAIADAPAGDVFVGVATTQSVSGKTITASSIDSSPIGASSANTGAFTTLTGVTIDGAIGSVTPAAVSATTVDTSGALAVGGDTDLQNNDLNNIGVAGTDITSSDANFAQPVTLAETLTMNEPASPVAYEAVNYTTTGPHRRALVGYKAAAANNTAFSFVTVNVPNNYVNAVIFVEYVVSSTNQKETKSGKLQVTINRSAGTTTARSGIAEVIAQQVINNGAESITVTFALGANVGAVGAAQTFDIQATVNSSTGHVATLMTHTTVLGGYYSAGALAPVTLSIP